MSLFLSSLSAFSQGLRIQGNDYVIDERTSYSVFEERQPTFRHELNLRFEISPQELSGDYARGYVLRIKNVVENTTYNILYNGQGENAVFNFNYEGKDVLITAELDKTILYEQHWVPFHLSFDLERDSLTLQIHEKVFTAKGLMLKKDWQPRIYFGRSEHVIDVPTFSLRNLSVGDRDKTYSFPLDESQGENVHDNHKKVVGRVQHPDWLINDAYYWDLNTSFHSKTVAGSIFNSESQEVYYVNKDSLMIYNVRTGEVSSKKYANACPMTFKLGTTFIDQAKNRLYVYDVFLESDEAVTITYLDLENYTWETVSRAMLPTQLHHHCNFLDEVNRRYIIFGGFGNTLYNKEFYSYDIDANRWDTLSFEGDKITPRYFSSMGYEKKNNVLYLFGGMGNESGNQSVGRMYYYDLYKIDLNDNRITKLWEIPWDRENMVPVRGMILENDSSFYTLCYPEHFSKSFLRLYRFSLKNGEHEILGDSIPIISEKITTHANLYYSKSLSKLYGIVQEFEHDDIASTAKVYAIHFPPVGKEKLTGYSDMENCWWWLSIPGIILVAAFIYMYIRRKKKVGDDTSIIKYPDESFSGEHSSHAESPRRPNAIYLFGDFSIIDRRNKEIGYMLSTKLKHLFFLILGYSLDKGITSQELNELLWPGKSEEKVKNSRGVALNNLRKVLGELDGIRLVYESGYFKIVLTNECYCDYIHCIEITSSSTVGQQMDDLMGIISRGKFLKGIDVSLLDSFKEEIERKVEPALYVGMERYYTSGNYAAAMKLCEGVFNIDPLNEDAIYYLVSSLNKLKMTDEAKRRYLLFVTEYKQIMDADYSRSFKDLLDR